MLVERKEKRERIRVAESSGWSFLWKLDVVYMGIYMGYMGVWVTAFAF